MIRNALTIDVEDYYQVSNFEGDIARQDWSNFPSRVVENTRRVLRILQRHQTTATFFVLGYVAEQHPELVSEIASAGHEIGCHSYWHRRVNQLTPQEFREDLQRSRDVLESQLGAPVTAYRAPSFSITDQALWALEILVEEGFTVDSSIVPTRHANPSSPRACREPFAYELASGRLWEFPIAVGGLGGRLGVPISGGGYFRLFPWPLTNMLLNRVNHRSQLPFAFYTHPWEFDPAQPRLNAGTRLKRFRHYVNLKTMEAKFERLLQSFRFGRLDEVLACHRQKNIPQSIRMLAHAS